MPVFGTEPAFTRIDEVRSQRDQDITEEIQGDLDARCWKAIRDLSTNPHSFES